MGIFGHRYPPVLKNWYSDDWITKVYGGDHSNGGGAPQATPSSCKKVPPPAACTQDFKQGRMVMLAGTTVKHTRSVDHTRYTPDHSGKTALTELLKGGEAQLAAFVEGQESAETAAGAVAAARIAATPQNHKGVLVEKKSASSKTAEAIAAMGECPDGKWELQGTQLVCPSAGQKQSGAGADPVGVPGRVEEQGEGEAAAEDVLGLADERLSTRLDPSRTRAACQLPEGRMRGLNDAEYKRLSSQYCAASAELRRKLPSGGSSLLAALHDGSDGPEIRASCATGELRWTDQGREIRSRMYGLGVSKESAAWVAAHGSAWRTLGKGQQLTIPFSGAIEYVEVVCAVRLYT